MHESRSNRGGQHRVRLALVLAAAGCNGDPPEMSPPPTDLENTENLVIEGTMSPGLEAYELAAEVQFSGVGIGDHNRDCETYNLLFSTANVVEFAWAQRTFKQRRGVFSREEDGSFRFVVPMDVPTEPSCDWKSMGMRVFIARDGKEVNPLGYVDRDYDEQRQRLGLGTAVTCSAYPKGGAKVGFSCDYRTRGREAIRPGPLRPECYRVDIRLAPCPDDRKLFACLENYFEFPDEVLFQSSSCQ